MVDKKYRSEYTGEEIDAAVTKINALDLNNYYDKSAIDAELDKKLDKTAAEATYYNKTEIDDQGHFENDAPNVQVSVGNLAADDEANLPTSKAVATYVGGQLGNLKADEVTATAAQTISSIKQVNGKITIGAAQDIQIAQSQVTGLGTALGGKQDNLSTDQLAAVNSGITKTKVGTYDGYATGKQDALSDDQLAAVNSGITAAKVGQYDGYATGKQDTLSATNKLSADFVSGLGAAAKKDVDATVSATSENLPTSKAVASYVSGEIDKISIPTVNNAALKDASGATIFTANASEDVQILVIDCGNASGWDA